jgi:hypothetical protein
MCLFGTGIRKRSGSELYITSNQIFTLGMRRQKNSGRVMGFRSALRVISRNNNAEHH